MRWDDDVSFQFPSSPGSATSQVQTVGERLEGMMKGVQSIRVLEAFELGLASFVPLSLGQF